MSQRVHRAGLQSCTVFRFTQVIVTCLVVLAAPFSSACTPQERPRTVSAVPATQSAGEPQETAAWAANIKDLVQFPSPEVEFIIGPQLKAGSRLNPAPWFDQNSLGRGVQLGETFPASAPRGTLLRGTVSVDQNSKQVVGRDTRFVADFPGAANNYYVLITDADGKLHSHYLASVQDDTHLTLSAPWQQASATGRQISKKTGDEADAYVNLNYYDHALCQYINYYRTGDNRFLAYARKVADSWWKSPSIDGGSVKPENSYAPRNSSLSGLMLRALEDHPEMWPWITAYTRYVFDTWVHTRIAYPGIYYGVRDPGYSLLYAANLARVHPDAAVRKEFRAKVLDAAIKYYARLQHPDGSWRWKDDAWVGDAMQPFHVGLLLEGLIAVHRLTGDAQVGRAITKGAEAIYLLGYNPKKWRATFYQVGGSWADGTKCERGCGAAALGFPPSDVGLIAEARQLNTTSIHALGYAYMLTKDLKFKQWGDEMFDSTYNGKDGYRGLANFRAKEYDEAYRSAGRYLAWRSAWAAVSVSEPGGVTPPDSKPVPPVSATENSPAGQLITAALTQAKELSTAAMLSESQIQSLLDQIETAQNAVNSEVSRLLSPDDVLNELKAARDHARGALAIVRAGQTGGEDSNLRLGWAAARLKRAADRMQPR